MGRWRRLTKEQWKRPYLWCHYSFIAAPLKQMDWVTALSLAGQTNTQVAQCFACTCVWICKWVCVCVSVSTCQLSLMTEWLMSKWTAAGTAIHDRVCGQFAVCAFSPLYAHVCIKKPSRGWIVGKMFAFFLSRNRRDTVRFETTSLCYYERRCAWNQWNL